MVLLPSDEVVPCRRFGGEQDGLVLVGKEVAAELARRYLLPVHGKLCFGNVCRQLGIELVGEFVVVGQGVDARSIECRADGCCEVRFRASVLEG